MYPKLKLLSKSLQKISLEVHRGQQRSKIARIYHIGSNLRSLIKEKMSKKSNSDFDRKLSLEQSWSTYLGRLTAEQEAKEILSTYKIERSERIKRSRSTGHLERSERLRGLGQPNSSSVARGFGSLYQPETLNKARS